MSISNVDGGEVASGEAQSLGREIYQMDRRIPLLHGDLSLTAVLGEELMLGHWDGKVDNYL